MIELKSIEGPDVHGTCRYRVKNPAKKDGMIVSDRKLAHYGLSMRNIVLDGEPVYVHHVSHVRLVTYPDELVIVVKPKVVKRMQCKDIPDLPILEFLAAQKNERGSYTWSTHSSKEHSGPMPTVRNAMPALNPSQWKLAPAKMNQLIRRGMVAGDTCLDGRGDYVITLNGLVHLENLKIEQDLEQSNYPCQEIDFT